jgi:MarR family 2-MHQ and catechol resistance regulon transcriptional repressor
MIRRKPVSAARYRAFLEVLRSADGLWDVSRRFLAPYGLSPSQFNVLHLLSDQPNGYSQIEVSRLLITHRSNVTGLVDRLVRRGWVARRDSNKDRRAYRIVLTTRGRATLNRVLPSYYRAADGIWKGAAIGSPGRLANALSKLCQNAERTVNGIHAHTGGKQKRRLRG